MEQHISCLPFCPLPLPMSEPFISEKTGQMISNSTPTQEEAEGLSTASALEEKSKRPIRTTPGLLRRGSATATSAPSPCGSSLSVGEAAASPIHSPVLSGEALACSLPFIAS